MTFITIYINIILCIILITCNKKLNFKIIFDFFLNSNILLHIDHNDDDIRMSRKCIYIIIEIITKNQYFIILFSND